MKYLLAAVISLAISQSVLAVQDPTKPQLKIASKQISQSKIAKVDLNKADLKALTRLPGVGDKKAQAIIDYRTKNGKFTSLQDLKKVKGIGDKLFVKIKSKVSL